MSIVFCGITERAEEDAGVLYRDTIDIAEKLSSRGTFQIGHAIKRDKTKAVRHELE